MPLRDSIEAHLTVVFAALAVSRWIETRTGLSIRKFVRTARRYKTIQIQAGVHVITAADPLPTDGVHSSLKERAGVKRGFGLRFRGRRVFAGHAELAPWLPLSPRRCQCSCERAGWVKDRAEPGRRRRRRRRP